jgi:hypothetical protein
MSRTITLKDGRRLDLDYFVEWRPWLWRRPVLNALAFLGDLRRQARPRDRRRVRPNDKPLCDAGRPRDDGRKGEHGG